jgi:hypothetical protein
MKFKYCFALSGLAYFLLLFTAKFTLSAENVWLKKSDMPTTRRDLATASANEIIYAIGGGLSAEGDWVGANVWEPFQRGIIEEYDTGFVTKMVDLKEKLATSWGRIRKF